MKSRDDRVKMYDVTVEAEFTSDQPCFNVDTDMDPLLTAKATALEPWSREYFQTLQKYLLPHTS